MYNKLYHLNKTFGSFEYEDNHLNKTFFSFNMTILKFGSFEYDNQDKDDRFHMMKLVYSHHEKFLDYKLSLNKKKLKTTNFNSFIIRIIIIPQG